MKNQISEIKDPLFFFGHSQTSQIARATDWSRTNLGDPLQWPQELKLILGMLFCNRHPVCLFWGKDLNYFYNDSYIPIVGQAKHPQAMGQKGSDVWSEVWEYLSPQINQVLAGGEATWNEDQLIPILGDDGQPREAYFTYSYSPVYLVTGEVAGVLVTCSEMTSRIVAEKRLIESKNEVENVLESMADAYFSLDSNWLITRVNSQHEKLTNTKRDEIIGKYFWDIFPVNDEQNKYWIEHHKVMRERVPSHFDECYKPLGLWTGTDVYPTIDGGIAVFFRDITAQKLARLRLKESEARFRQLIETLPQLVWSCAPTGECDYFSKQWLEYTGLPIEQQLGFGWIDTVLHPEDKARTYEHWMGAVRGDHPYDIEYRLRRFDGAYRWFKTRGTHIKNESGDGNVWFGTCTDIEESKQAQLSFERNVDTSPSMLWITEPDGYCSYLSHQWYENTGQTMETGLGYGWVEATHPEDKALAEKAFVEANAKRIPFRCEYRLRNKDGNYRWCIDAGNPRFDREGVYLGMAGTVFDVHERKLAEEAALTLSQSLQTAVRARDEFLSIASHELQTPITSLKMQLQLTQRGLLPGAKAVPTPEKISRVVNISLKQVDRLTSLVDDLLDISRIESGKLSFNLTTVDLNQLLAELVERFEEQAKEAGCTISLLQESRPLVEADSFRLDQVFSNLLSNAIKYSTGGNILIAIKETATSALISFADSGLGIDERKIHAIFDRFERAIDGTKISGLGLGLYITKNIIEAHHGTIRVESKLGVGSTFTVELPKLA